MGKKSSYPEEFEAFWAEYPRPVGKPAAFRAWQACADDRPELAELIDAIRHQWLALAWADKDVSFIPHPTTWLNQHRWEDNGQKRKPPSLIAQQKAAAKRYEQQIEVARAQRLQELRGMEARKARERGATLVEVSRPAPRPERVQDLLGDLTASLRRGAA